MISQEAVAPVQKGILPRPVRLAYFVSHPIQYQAPLLKQIAAQPDIDLTVFFTSDFSVREYQDRGFGIPVEWDVPLLQGYRHEFLPKYLKTNASHERQISSHIYRRLRAGRFDTVWVHGYHTADALQAIISARLLNIPVLVRCESTLYDRPRSRLTICLKRILFRALGSCIAGVLCIGKSNREYWRHYLGPDCPMFDMPYAVDNQFFQKRSRESSALREALRRELGFESGRPVILFASKLQKRKRCLDLVEAYLRLSTEITESERPYLLIVGDGEERKEIQRRGHASEGIRLLGFRNQSELPRYFDLCDVFVLPSIDEPWGLVVNEAMNAGKAIVVSDEVGCQPDLVQDGVNGCVFRARDTGSLAEALRRVLLSPGATQRMGEASLRAIQDYSFGRDIEGLRLALSVVTKRHGLEPSNTSRMTFRAAQLKPCGVGDNLRILYLGSSKGTSGYRAAAMVRQGHDVTLLDPYILVPENRFTGKWNWITGGLGSTEVLRWRVLDRIKQMEFDVAWVDHGELVAANLVAALKNHASTVLCYNLDDPFGTRDGRLWLSYLAAVPHYDLLVVLREQNVQEALARGAKRVIRVYQSADEIAHAPCQLTEAERKAWQSDVLFVGTAFRERGPFLAELVRLGVPLTLYGDRYKLLREWPILKPHWRGGAINDADRYAKAIGAARVCLGLLSKGNRDLHTTRSMEIPSLGGLLCAERTSEHQALYEEDREAVFWSDAQECAEKCFLLLSDDTRRGEIASRGRERFLKNDWTNGRVVREVLVAATTEPGSPSDSNRVLCHQ